MSNLSNDWFPCRFPANRPAGKLSSLPADGREEMQAFDYKWFCRAATVFCRDGEKIFPVFPARQGKRRDREAVKIAEQTGNRFRSALTERAAVGEGI
jgi:hypothetical protein